MNNDKIAAFITELRKSKNMTQKELAAQHNITDKAVSKWERGQSLPDITLLPHLCELLGVSINELLDGKRLTSDVQTDCAASPSEPVYAETDNVQLPDMRHNKNTKILALLLVTAALLVGVLVCLICDVATTRSISWSLYPLGSAVLAWCVTAPFLLSNKRAGVYALSALTILIVPFLLLIQYQTAASWLYPVGVFCALSSLAYLWIVLILWSFTRINRWYVAAITLFLAPVLDYAITAIIGGGVSASLGDPFNLVTLISCAAAGIVLYTIGYTRRKRTAVKTA